MNYYCKFLSSRHTLHPVQDRCNRSSKPLRIWTTSRHLPSYTALTQLPPSLTGTHGHFHCFRFGPTKHFSTSGQSSLSATGSRPPHSAAPAPLMAPRPRSSHPPSRHCATLLWLSPRSLSPAPIRPYEPFCFSQTLNPTP